MCGKEFNKAFELYDQVKKNCFLSVIWFFRKIWNMLKKGKSLKLKVIFKETWAIKITQPIYSCHRKWITLYPKLDEFDSNPMLQFISCELWIRYQTPLILNFLIGNQEIIILSLQGRMRVELDENILQGFSNIGYSEIMCVRKGCAWRQ